MFLVPGDTLGRFAAQTWVRDGCFMIAGASTLGCGAMGWTLWEGRQRRTWVLTTVGLLVFLSAMYLFYKPDK